MLGMYYAVIELSYQIYYISVSIVLAFIIGGVSYLLSAKVAEYDLGSAYECGFEPFEESHRPFSITFYLIGLLFVLLDIEILLLLPWCFVCSDQVWNSWIFMILFFQLLLLGFMFEWSRGAISVLLR